MTDVTDMTSEIKGGKGIVKGKVGHKVADRSTVSEWYAGTSHRLRSEHGTRLVRRDIAQVANRSMVPSWYTGVLYK